MTAFFFIDYAIINKLTPFISMQNHYILIYREEEREMFPTLKVRPCHFFCLRNDFFKALITFSTWALVRFHGPLLLAVFLRVLMETILRSAHRVMGMDIDNGSHFSKTSFFPLFRYLKGYSKNAGTEQIINT